MRLLDGDTLSVQMPPQASVRELQLEIEACIGVPPTGKRLVFGGTQLSSSALLADCSVQHGGEIALMLALKGGAERGPTPMQF